MKPQQIIAACITAAGWIAGGILGLLAIFVVGSFILTPSRDYLVPVVTQDGSIFGFTYQKSRWWGIDDKRHPARWEHDRFVYVEGTEEKSVPRSAYEEE